MHRPTELVFALRDPKWVLPNFCWIVSVIFSVKKMVLEVRKALILFKGFFNSSVLQRIAFADRDGG